MEKPEQLSVNIRSRTRATMGMDTSSSKGHSGSDGVLERRAPAVVGRCGNFLIHRINVERQPAELGGRRLGMQTHAKHWFPKELRLAFPGFTEYSMIKSVSKGKPAELAGLEVNDILCWPAGKAPVVFHDLCVKPSGQGGEKWVIVEDDELRGHLKKQASKKQAQHFYVARKMGSKQRPVSESTGSQLHQLSSDYHAAFGQIGFCQWGKSARPRPVLLLSPLDVPLAAQSLWSEKFESCQRRDRLDLVGHVVYWYGSCDTKACFSYVASSSLKTFDACTKAGLAELPVVVRQEARTTSEMETFQAIRDMKNDLKVGPTDRRRCFSKGGVLAARTVRNRLGDWGETDQAEAMIGNDEERVGETQQPRARVATMGGTAASSGGKPVAGRSKAEAGASTTPTRKNPTVILRMRRKPSHSSDSLAIATTVSPDNDAARKRKAPQVSIRLRPQKSRKVDASRNGECPDKGEMTNDQRAQHASIPANGEVWDTSQRSVQASTESISAMVCSLLRSSTTEAGLARILARLASKMLSWEQHIQDFAELGGILAIVHVMKTNLNLMSVQTTSLCALSIMSRSSIAIRRTMIKTGVVRPILRAMTKLQAAPLGVIRSTFGLLDRLLVIPRTAQEIWNNEKNVKTIVDCMKLYVRDEEAQFQACSLLSRLAHYSVPMKKRIVEAGGGVVVAQVAQCSLGRNAKLENQCAQLGTFLYTGG